MVKKDHEKRKNHRYDIEFIISISKGGEIVSPHNAVKNFSLSGCCILVANNYSFHMNDKILLNIEDNFLKKSFNFNIEAISGIVKHIDENNIFLIGIEFFNLSKNNLKIIQYIIDNGLILKEYPKTWQLSR